MTEETNPVRRPSRVSVHGGHSAQFCSHARDRLEEVVDAYAEQRFEWVGITEHMPAARDAMVPPEERAAGLDAVGTRERFAAYFDLGRRLQAERRDQIEVFVAFEAEAYSGYEVFLEELLAEFRPDYIVGSVHHVNDVPFDMSREHYAAAVERAGDLEELYCDYFDLQYELIEAFDPAVVGHFDLIRIFDRDYAARLRTPRIWERVERNLHAVAARGAILDFNVRALSKGQSEPYVTAPILARARELAIAVVPGDDSHGVDTVGSNVDRGAEILARNDFDTAWRRPA